MKLLSGSGLRRRRGAAAVRAASGGGGGTGIFAGTVAAAVLGRGVAPAKKASRAPLAARRQRATAQIRPQLFVDEGGVQPVSWRIPQEQHVGAGLPRASVAGRGWAVCVAGLGIWYKLSNGFYSGAVRQAMHHMKLRHKLGAGAAVVAVVAFCFYVLRAPN